MISKASNQVMNSKILIPKECYSSSQNEDSSEELKVQEDIGFALRKDVVNKTLI